MQKIRLVVSYYNMGIAMTIYETIEVNGKKISVCDIQEDDIAIIVDYWHNSDEAFLDSMGVDHAKITSREATAAKFIDSIPSNRGEFSRMTLIFKHDNKPIGYTNVNFDKDRIGYAHVHIINANYRQIGFVARLFKRCIDIYKNEFDVKDLRFQTNTENRRINRYLEKMGYKIAGTDYIDKPDGMARPGWYHTYIS
jgi:RimJ/RimL family protein N-acetyltransferase